jgi:TonB-linked SusC/RagA family outer membrane protein
MLCITQAFAQNRTVTGTVTAKDDGLPIPGVSVKIKGTSLGVQTGANGKYTISVPGNGVLIFSYIGFATQEKPVNGASVVDVSLTTASTSLGEVVVTGALGIKKQEKEVGYATTRITGASADETAPVDPINGLTGKVAGLVIQQTSDGIDPTLKVNLRGNRSLLGYNGALFVLDGVPVAPEIIQSLSPDDIDDYNVLNGSGATALYGSEASNGAVVITTKKGTKNGKPVVTYSNTFQLQQAAIFPKLQSSYGQYGGEGNYGFSDGLDLNFINSVTGFPNHVPFENELWGPAFNGSTVQEGIIPINGSSAPSATLLAPYTFIGKNPVKAFFQIGTLEQNDLTVSDGDAKNSFYFGISTASQKGITPEDSTQRIATHLAVTRTYGIFRADLSTNFARTTISTNGGADYTGDNNLYSNLLQFPANLNINSPDFKDVNNPNSFGNPSWYFSGYSTNPWWTIEDSRTNTQRDVFSGNLNMTLSPTKWLDASYRVSDAFGVYQTKENVAEVDFSPIVTQSAIARQNGLTPTDFPNGIQGRTTDIIGYGDGTASTVNTGGTVPEYNGPLGYARLQGDALLNFHQTFFNDFKTSLLLGNTIWEEKMNYTYDNSNALLAPGFYNVAYNTSTPTIYNANAVIRQISYYGDFNINYKGFANIEATLRNDQDSRLDPAGDSFFYPSLKGTFVPTDAFSALKGSVFDYLKLYADVSRVGQVVVGPYNINNTFQSVSGFPFGSLGGLTPSASYIPPGLKPQTTTEFEFGGELGFFNDRLDVKADYYTQNNTNQTLSIGVSPTTGYGSFTLNAGDVKSYGEEMSLTAIVFQKGLNSVGWTVGSNLSINESDVVSLANGAPSLFLGGNSFAVVGKSYPQLEVTDYARDPQGQVIVSPSTGEGSEADGVVDMGRTTPKYDLGVNTTLSYKFLTLTIVAEYRGGNVIYNGIGPTMTFAGSDYFSSQAGRQIFVIPGSVNAVTGSNGAVTYVPNTTPTPSGGINYWVDSPGGPDKLQSPYVTSAAFWKIREVALDANLSKFIKNKKYIKGLSAGINARNLLTFLPKTEIWGDPEQDDAGTGNSIGTNSTSELPSSRYFGAQVKVTF